MGTTTNLGITFPESSGYVTNGATAMQTIANDVDDYFGAWTAYTPTGTNISGGTYDAAYQKIGKLGFLRINITAGTATAAGSIAVTLPTGWSSTSNSGFAAQNGTVGLCTCFVNSITNTITIYNGTALANWAAAASVANTRIIITLELD